MVIEYRGAKHKHHVSIEKRILYEIMRRIDVEERKRLMALWIEIRKGEHKR